VEFLPLAIFYGAFAAVALSVPVRFVLDPSCVQANGLYGQVSVSVSLGAFALSLGYLVRVYRQTPKTPPAAPDEPAGDWPRSPEHVRVYD